MENVKKRDKLKPEHYDSGMISSSGSGNANTGFSSISVTHPFGNNATIAGLTALQSSRFESDPYPRAIIERQIMYNADFSYTVPAPGGGYLSSSSQFFNSKVSVNADAILNTAGATP